MNEIIETLSCCPLFNGKTPADLQGLISKCEYYTKTFQKGELIATIGKKSPYIGIIINGVVEARKILMTGTNVCIIHKKKGELFGGSAVFSKKNTYLCELYAVENGKTLFIHRDSIFKLISNDPVIAANIIGLFADTIIDFENKMELFSYSGIKQKIAFYILNAVHETGGNEVVIPLSKSKWAEYLNVSRPSLCRELKTLSDENIIEITGKKIKIIKREQLEFLLENNTFSP